uniref:Olfactory receptor n=1 Tax=Salvator merianae TaxID=96440 RepID=A0A8D0E518_SALMN
MINNKYLQYYAPDIQMVHFMMFLIMYLAALLGNFLILATVALDHQLHSPMYFFLFNLSLIDVSYISTTVPKSIAVSLTSIKLISYAGCVTQVFLDVTFISGELAILTVMAYDRYVAICHPLQYRLIMNWNVCIQMASASWVVSVFHAVLETTMTFSLKFCRSNIIGQFFCDIPQLQKISCSDTNAHQVLIFVLGFFVDSFCFGFIFASYGYIFSAVMKIPSTEGRCKAFSTCTPHLTVFSMFIITGVFSYMRPKSLSSPAMNFFSGILYTILPPVLNPVIYSFRNKEIQKAIGKITVKMKIFHSFGKDYA